MVGPYSHYAHSLTSARIGKLVEQPRQPAPGGIQSLFEIVIDEGVSRLRRLCQRHVDLLSGLLEPRATRLVVHASDERPCFLQESARVADAFEHLAAQRRMSRMLFRASGPVTARTFPFQRLW